MSWSQIAWIIINERSFLSRVLFVGSTFFQYQFVISIGLSSSCVCCVVCVWCVLCVCISAEIVENRCSKFKFISNSPTGTVSKYPHPRSIQIGTCEYFTCIKSQSPPLFSQMEFDTRICKRQNPKTENWWSSHNRMAYSTESWKCDARLALRRSENLIEN